MIVTGVNQRVRGSMNVTRIDQIIEMQPTVASALAVLAPKP